MTKKTVVGAQTLAPTPLPRYTLTAQLILQLTLPPALPVNF